MRPVNFGQMWYWPNLAKFGQIRMAKTGLATCDHGSPTHPVMPFSNVYGTERTKTNFEFFAIRSP